MKKLLFTDIKLRNLIKNFTIKYLIIKLLIVNKNIFFLIKSQLLDYFNYFIKFYIFVAVVNRCVLSFNQKYFNKYTYFCRAVFSKKILNGYCVGFKKSIF